MAKPQTAAMLAPSSPFQFNRLDYYSGKGMGLFLAKLNRIKE